MTRNTRSGSWALAALLLGAALTASAASPEPFEGRLTGYAPASRQVVVDGLTYPLSSTVLIQDEAGKPLRLLPVHIGAPVRVSVAAPVEGAKGPAPILVLTVLAD